MNLHAEIRSSIAALPQALKKADYALTFAEHEDETAEWKPSPADLKAIAHLAEGVGELADEVLVTIAGHRTETGEGFRPAHLQVTVSLLDPDASIPAHHQV